MSKGIKLLITLPNMFLTISSEKLSTSEWINLVQITIETYKFVIPKSKDKYKNMEIKIK